MTLRLLKQPMCDRCGVVRPAGTCGFRPKDIRAVLASEGWSCQRSHGRIKDFCSLCTKLRAKRQAGDGQ